MKKISLFALTMAMMLILAACSLDSGTTKNESESSKKDDDYLISRLNISNYVSYSKFLLRLFIPY